MNFKTISSVHSLKQSRDQRRHEQGKEHWCLSAVCVYTHFIIGFSMHMYDHVSTPGWISVLGTLPFLGVLLYLGHSLYINAGSDDTLTFAVGENGRRIFSFFFFVIHALDALTVFFALGAIIRDVMPDHSVFLSSLAICVFCAWALAGSGANAIPRLSRFLSLLAAILFLWCIFQAVPHGNAAHFFPFWGYGAASISRGALWICGAYSSAVWPFLRPKEARECQAPIVSGRKPFFYLLFSLLAAIITYSASVWLMPVYALARPESMGWRMLLLTHMTPSAPVWSMEVLGLFLLLLYSLCACVWQACDFLAVFTGKQNKAFFSFLFFLLLPSCLIDQPELQGFLLLIYPWRGFAVLALLAILRLACVIRRKKTKKPEAQPV